MVANSQSRSSSRDDDVTLSVLQDDVMMQVSNASYSSPTLDCPHCDFKCDSSAIMTQHSWEQHPLLMRRKKHLITTPKQEMTDEVSHSVVTENKVRGLETTKKQGIEVPNHQLSQNNESSSEVVTAPEKAPMDYRENAIRSISLLSTAAAILESHSVLSQERHPPTAEISTQERGISTSPYQLETVQPLLAPLYRVYVPSLNQYVTVPINMTPISNSNVQNSLVQYLHGQHHRPTVIPQIADRVPYSNYSTPKPQVASFKPQSPSKQPTDEIRNLLATSNAMTSEKEQIRHNSTQRKVTKGHRSKQPAQSSSKNGDACPLGEERRKQLEDALLSMDCCDINDSSTTMPFKCSDGVWRMVKFKCIKGLWVVQTPDSNTPTVYVPCDEHHPKVIHQSRHKRKLSTDPDFDVDSKRLCASAPVLSGNDESRPSVMKRTLSNPFITKQLPAPSQYFTSNEGKRVNISVVKRITTSSSSDLIKSLLLRKPSSTMTPQSGSSSMSSVDEKAPCRDGKTTGIATTFSKTLLKSSLAF